MARAYHESILAYNPAHADTGSSVMLLRMPSHQPLLAGCAGSRYAHSTCILLEVYN